MRALILRLGLLALAGVVAAPTVWPRPLWAAEATVPSGDGVPISYRVEGAGEPTLVFVHCWACDQHFWDGQVEHFANSHRVVTLDLPGHGASGDGRRDWTIAAFADDVMAVVEALALERVVLIGHSMGGPVVVEAARRMPGRVAALVPVDTLQDVDARMAPQDREAMLADLQADFRGATERFMRQFLFAPGTDAALVDRIVGGAAAMPPAVAIPTLAETMDYDSRPALREIEAPIRALNADLAPTNLAAARRHAPQFDAVIMTGVGHYPMLEDGERFNALLEGILQDVR